MNDWMISDKCRRLKLHAFLDDAEAVTCGSMVMDESLCDNCTSQTRRRLKAPDREKVDEFEPLNEAGVEDIGCYEPVPVPVESVVTKKVRTDAVGRDRLSEVVLPTLQGVCTFCFYLRKERIADHQARSCPLYTDQKELLKSISSRLHSASPSTTPATNVGSPKHL